MNGIGFSNFSGIIHVLKTRQVHECFAKLPLLPLCCWLSVSIRCARLSYGTRQQKNIRKGTTLLLEGSLGDARPSDLVSFFCLVTSSTISYQMHLLHISFSLLRDVTIWKNLLQLFVWDRSGAGDSCEEPGPHFLITIDPSLRTLGVFLTQAVGVDESGALLSSAFPFQTLTPSETEFSVQLGSDIM